MEKFPEDFQAIHSEQTAMTTNEASRAEFEAWAISHRVLITRDVGGLEYHYAQAKAAWCAWQAALASRPIDPIHGDKREVISQTHGVGYSSAKITPEIAIYIYKSKGNQRLLAEKLGISQSDVSRIRSGQVWRRHTEGLANRKRGYPEPEVDSGSR
jgi:hypothetical protein